jgi:hypothetical protein
MIFGFRPSVSVPACLLHEKRIAAARNKITVMTFLLHIAPGRKNFIDLLWVILLFVDQ